MSSPPLETLGLKDDEAGALGADGATRVRTFRLLILLGQELRTLMDQRLRPDGLTTQQAALITIVDLLDDPSISLAASAMGTTHQNVKQLATALERKGFLRIAADRTDGRVKRLRTTARSRRYWEGRSSSDQAHVLEWFAGLSESEAATLFGLLRKLEDGVREALAPPV